MKRLRIETRVEGVAKRISGRDGTIVEVIQDGRKKKFKIRWNNGLESVHPSEALKEWGAPVVVRGPNLEREVAPAIPIAAPRAADAWEYDPEIDGHSDAGSVNSGAYGSRSPKLLAINVKPVIIEILQFWST